MPEGAIQTVKAAMNPRTILKIGLGVLALLVIADLLGVTDYVLRPWTAMKAKMDAMKSNSAA